jgi:hypothetical protein
MPAIPGLASLAGSLPGSVRVLGRTPTGLGVAERAGARGTSEIQIAGCARRCFRAEIEGRGFDSPHLQESSLSSEGCWGCSIPVYRFKISWAQAIASDTRIPDGCGRTHSSRFSGRLSFFTPFRWRTDSVGSRLWSLGGWIPPTSTRTPTQSSVVGGHAPSYRRMISRARCWPTCSPRAGALQSCGCLRCQRPKRAHPTH